MITMSKCQSCDGSGLTGPGLPIIGCGPCALCNGTGATPEFKVHILSAEVSMHDRPRFKAWYGGECPVEEGTVSERVYRDGVMTLSQSAIDDYIWRHWGNKDDIIAYRVIDQD